MEKYLPFKKLERFSDIIKLMIDGLEKRWVNVDMDTFGFCLEGICFGCAATNTICQIINEPFNPDSIQTLDKRTEKVNYGISSKELGMFESAIDNLRMRNLYAFMHFMEGISHIFSFKIPDGQEINPPLTIDLPVLGTKDYLDNLPKYKEYYEYLVGKGL